MRIAVIDNTPEQAELVHQALASGGHACTLHASGVKGLAPVLPEDADLLIIDWQAHPSSTPDVVRAIHGSRPALPILLLVGRADEDGLLAALAAGATDYQVKPLRRGELVMRVQTLLKRAYPQRQADVTVRFGNFAFDANTCRLALNDVPLDVTQKEFALALLFFRNLGRPLSRAYIQENVWSREADVPSRTMDTHVSRIRNKLGLRPENGFRLAPVYSFGYRLEQLAR
ncbi:response regulator transcription factor [Noviherbaspirillum autotrophicum]|uniref:XRE family transcriptional regulator n=1 Tax=Noviherbaspirillum autotrophicum TaxID=709839 RepID=A0A0C2BK32_9BURK|nr:response regulator transcription factor [Noviherbaspirillum autotrophicum]KIF80369.1 XRE family transcriptional regulator [Noviherbaspirillum autotrophicum]